IRGLLMILRRFRRIGRRLDVAEQLLDPVLPGDRFVVLERELRRSLQAQPRSDLAAEKRRRTSERALGIAPARLVAERGVVHARLLQVRRHLHAGQRDEADPGIANVAREQQRELATNLFADAVWSGA